MELILFIKPSIPFQVNYLRCIRPGFTQNSGVQESRIYNFGPPCPKDASSKFEKNWYGSYQEEVDKVLLFTHLITYHFRPTKFLLHMCGCRKGAFCKFVPFWQFLSQP